MDYTAQEVVDDLERWYRDYPPKRDCKPEGIFEVGFCMAGAVSAGAYTAGVLDVFIEALDAFALERDARIARGEKPLHEVRVPVLGGASAGGMCAAIAALFLDARFPAVRPEMPEAERRRNPLYRAWVSDIDIRPLLGTEDVRRGQPLASLLDCTVLDRIVDGLMDERPRMETARRPWLADPLRAVLTLSNLRGVPYALSFEGSGLRHWMSHHADHVRFAVALDPGAGAAPEDPIKIGETPLDRRAPRGSGAREGFKAVALGTGGFPVALAPRVLTRPAEDYLYRAVLTPSGPLKDDRVVLRPRPGWADGVVPAWRPAAPKPYSALCVDGGAMNNEPLDLVRRVLAGHGAASPRPATEARRALLLVDPFMNPGKPGPEAPQGLIGSIMPLFNALVQNSRFKPEDLALAVDPDIGSRFLLAPSRGPDWQAEGAIAAGHLGGFLGFFAQAYREHDFFLGRRNAQSFLRRRFVLPEGNPLFGPRWTDGDRERWGVRRDGAAGRHLPIIPLCGALAEREERLPEWPAGRFSAAEVAPLIKQRADAAVPALRDALMSVLLAKQRGIWPWLGRKGAWGLGALLTPRLAEAVVDRVAEAVSTLDTGRHIPAE